jgi:hypothetical protein
MRDSICAFVFSAFSCDGRLYLYSAASGTLTAPSSHCEGKVS